MRKEMRKKLDEMNARRFERLANTLTEDQLAKYRKSVDDRRKWWGRKRRHRSDKHRRDQSPNQAP